MWKSCKLSVASVYKTIIVHHTIGSERKTPGASERDVTVTVWCAPGPHRSVTILSHNAQRRTVSSTLHYILVSSGQTCRAARKNCMPAAAMTYMPEISAAMSTVAFGIIRKKVMERMALW